MNIQKITLIMQVYANRKPLSFFGNSVYLIIDKKKMSKSVGKNERFLHKVKPPDLTVRGFIDNLNIYFRCYQHPSSSKSSLFLSSY